MLLQGNTFSESAGAAVFLDGASATLSSNTYDDFEIGIVQQGCTATSPPEGLDEEAIPNAELCPTYDYWTEDLTLEPYFREADAAP